MASQQAFAPDWGRFHAAIVSHQREGEILVACERAWAWLESPAEDCARRIADTIRNEEAVRWQLQALPFIRLRLLREAGMAPPTTAQCRWPVLTPWQRGRQRPPSCAVAPPGCLAGHRPAGGRALSRRRTPAPLDVQPEELLARTPALTEAMHACDVARATPQGLARLQAAIAVFDAAGANASDDIAREQAWWLGLAWWPPGARHWSWGSRTNAAMPTNAPWRTTPRLRTHRRPTTAVNACATWRNGARLTLIRQPDASSPPCSRAATRLAERGH